MALAIAQLEELLDETPDDLRDRYLLALCYRLNADLNAALVSVDGSKLTEAIDEYAKARFAMQDLSGRSPAVHRYRVELGQLLLNIGQLDRASAHSGGNRQDRVRHCPCEETA